MRHLDGSSNLFKNSSQKTLLEIWSCIVQRLLFLCAFFSLFASPTCCHADILDLATSGDNTTPNTTSGTVGGGLFAFGQIAAGTGNFDPFLRIQSNSTEAGYNTDGGTPFDTKSGTWTHSVLMADVPTVKIGGTYYFEFLLDINETQNANGRYLSLDELKIYESNSGNQTSEVLTTLGALKYDLDGGADNTVLFNTFNSGSGVADYSALIPIWSGADQTKYLTFYTSMGNYVETTGPMRDFSSSSGFEEWAFDPGRATFANIPEPGSFAFLTMITLVLGILFCDARRRRNLKPKAD